MRGLDTTQHRILLIEDDPGDQELIRRALAETAVVHALQVVDDGEEALSELARRVRRPEAALPDLILLDFNLPKLDGKQVLARLKRDEHLRHIPVVVLSTSQQEKDIRGCYENGANSYIVKPVELTEWFRTVRDLVAYWFGMARLPRGEE